ncbi:hypothetical protein D3C78_1334170 [compost metagenome]
MALQKFTLWMHRNTEGHSYAAGQVWLAQVNIAGQRNYEDCISLGSVEIEIDVPEIDTRHAAVEALQAQIQQERADSQMRVNLLQERIGKLLAIGHYGGEV